MPPLRGIFHSAGVLDDGVLSQQSWDRFTKVLAAKVDGTWNLHLATQDRPLDLFVLFSSATALLGTPSQGNYAAANAFLDSFAHYRRAQGLPALSINWGVWAEVGLAAQAERSERLARRGLIAMTPEEGLAGMAYLFHQEVTQSAIMPVDWPTYLAQLPTGSRTAWLAALSQAQGGAEAQPQTSQGSVILQQLAAAAPAERYELLVAYIRQQVVNIMRFEADYPLETQQGFFQLGMDSLMTLELRNRLQASLQCTLPSTLAFDYPSIALLARYLLETLFAAAAETEPEHDQDDALLDDLDTLSRDELKALLDQELESIDEGLMG
jgi:acyl carrier protein